MADADKATSRKRANHSRLLCFIQKRMARHREIVGAFTTAFVFALFSRYSWSSPPVTAAAPGPKRFFPRPSYVEDFYYGQLFTVAQLVKESMYARHQYEQAAKYFKHKVTFVAVNCWYEFGTCRQQYNFISFPTIFVYHTHLDGYKYNGVMRAEYIIQFVSRLLKPIKRLNSRNKLVLYLAQRQNVVLGYFDFHSSPQPPGFAQFYYAAMRVQEHDLRTPVDFAVLTNPVLAAGFLAQPRSACLVRTLNTTLVYPSSHNFTSSEIVKWVIEHSQQSAINMHNPSGKLDVPYCLGTKSAQLFNMIGAQPTLLLFIPDMPLAQNHYYSQLRELSLDYHTCDSSPKLPDLADALEHLRWRAARLHLADQAACRGWRSERRRQRQQCCQSLASSATASDSCDVCHINRHPGKSALRDCSHVSYWTSALTSSAAVVPQYSRTVIPGITYRGLGHVSVNCDRRRDSVRTDSDSESVDTSSSHVEDTDPSELRESSDEFIREAVTSLQSDLCHRLKVGRLNRWTPVLNLTDPGVITSDHKLVTGLACADNRTLHMVAMNTRVTMALARSLGLDNTPETAQAAIIDIQNESYHRLQNPVSRSALGEFVRDWHRGTLPRALRSVSDPHNVKMSNLDDKFGVIELTNVTFLSVVFQKQKDVLVLYYAPWCGFCKAFSHIYLELAHHFQFIDSLQVTRINADRHELPYHLQAGNYPTVVLFPAFSKDHSVRYPAHLALTFTGLVRFVLRHTSPPTRMRAALAGCDRPCVRLHLRRLRVRMRGLRGQQRALESRLRGARRRLYGAWLRRDGQTGVLRVYLRRLQARRRRLRRDSQAGRTLSHTLMAMLRRAPDTRTAWDPSNQYVPSDDAGVKDEL